MDTMDGMDAAGEANLADADEDAFLEAGRPTGEREEVVFFEEEERRLEEVPEKKQTTFEKIVAKLYADTRQDCCRVWRDGRRRHVTVEAWWEAECHELARLHDQVQAELDGLRVENLNQRQEMAALLELVDARTAKAEYANELFQEQARMVADFCTATGKMIEGEVPDVYTLGECLGRMRREIDSRHLLTKPTDVLCAEIEGLRAERDHHRAANEALRARNAELEDALRLIAKSQCPRGTSCSESEDCITEWCDGCVARRALIDAAREQSTTKEQEA